MVDPEKVKEEITEKLQELVGRVEYSPEGIAQVNSAVSEIVRRMYNTGEIEAGETSDPSSNGEIRLAEGMPLEILTFIPGALSCQVSEYGKYHVIQSGEIIGYVTYSGPPKQDTVGYACIGTKAEFAPVDMGKPNGAMFIDGKHAADCYVYSRRTGRDTMEVCVRGTPKPMSIEQKYRHAILTLQAIAQRSGRHKNGAWDEWSEAAAFRDCNAAAYRALQYLGEQTIMPNMAKKE